MAEHKKTYPRRHFLKQAAGLAGATSLLPGAAPAQGSGLAAPAAVAPPATAVDSATSPPYQSLSPEEASFIEALVNAMCPAESLPERLGAPPVRRSHRHNLTGS